MKTNDIRKKLKKKRSKKRGVSKKDYLSTGSTLLNLACSGKPDCGYIKGYYCFLVGDSASGKTFLALTCLAEASVNKNFDGYQFIYDDGEGGAIMDIEKFFGKEVFKRMVPPNSSDKTRSENSSTIEEFYYNVDDAIKKGTPFIYILDSMDSLSSADEAGKFKEQKTAYRRGKTTAGSFGDGKAKKNSANLRTLLTPLRKSGSILIILNQTRDNLGFGFEKKTRSGGRALRFYTCLEIWSSIKKRIKKNVKGKERQLGIQCLAHVKKNRLTGRERKVLIPIYHSYGIDDIGSCIDYLIEEGHWKKGTSIIAKEFSFKGKKGKLIKYIEENSLESELKKLVTSVWNEIEAACSIKRKQRY